MHSLDTQNSLLEATVVPGESLPSSGFADMRDLRAYSNEYLIIGTYFDDDEVTINWDDGHVSRFHHGWLRENSPDSKSRHPSSRERLVQPHSIPLFIKPLAAEIDGHGVLVIVWDGPTAAEAAQPHVSRFDAGWLRAHCYTRKAEIPVCQASPTPQRDAPQASWHDLMTSETAFYEWLVGLAEAGWSIVSDVPHEEGACIRFGQRIGVVRSSNFGFSFDVKSKPQPNSNAYTSLYLPLHTDMPHYELPPGFQLLHFLATSTVGGESLLVDGIAIAHFLRNENPEAFRILSTETIPYRFQDDDSDYMARHRIIECDDVGRPTHINWSNSTSAPLDVPYERMPALRGAIRAFLEATEDPRFLIERKLSAGGMLVFNNRRMLHGRKGFDSRTGDRHLQGCYLDTSEVRSRMAVLARRQNVASQEAWYPGM